MLRLLAAITPPRKADFVDASVSTKIRLQITRQLANHTTPTSSSSSPNPFYFISYLFGYPAVPFVSDLAHLHYEVIPPALIRCELLISISLEIILQLALSLSPSQSHRYRTDIHTRTYIRARARAHTHGCTGFVRMYVHGLHLSLRTCSRSVSLLPLVKYHGCRN